MVNGNTDYHSLNITEDTMLGNDYDESVLINEHDENNFDNCDNNEIVQEIFDTDINIDQSSNVWYHNAVSYLIYCWSQLREQFVNCPDKKKKILWQLISERMVQRDFYFDAQACENKWRSLKKIYMYNKTRTTKKDGTKHIIIWTHYCNMDRAIKGIPFDISGINVDDDNGGGDNYDDDDYDDDDLKEFKVDNCINTVKGYKNNTDSMSVTDIDKCQWTVDSTRELIRLYDKNRKHFLNVNQGGKHLLWEEIARQFCKLGYRYSANVCNDKWRYLKMTYKKNKSKALKYGVECVKWFYYNDIDNIFKNSSQELPENTNIITVSLTDDNEVLNTKKETDTEYNDNIVYQQTPDEGIIVENNEESSSSSDFWTEAATKCLIQLWGLYQTRFLSAVQGQKRLLWNEISEKLHQFGHNYSGLICDRKWRLLKANYFKRKEKYKKLGVNSVKWQYYYELDRLLGTPVGTISWNTDSTMCLIDSFSYHKDKFMKAATGEKLLVWKQISQKMLENGFNYSPRACDNKWRTLKNRYNKNRMRANRNKKVVWVYYNKIDSVLKEINKEKKLNEISNADVINPACENNDLDEHNYIRTSKQGYIKTEIITELKDMFKLRNTEFDQKLKKMEDNLNNRETIFQELQQQTLEALKRSNELEAHKIRLLEQLVSRLPNTL